MPIACSASRWSTVIRAISSSSSVRGRSTARRGRRLEGAVSLALDLDVVQAADNGALQLPERELLALGVDPHLHARPGLALAYPRVTPRLRDTGVVFSPTIPP